MVLLEKEEIIRMPRDSDTCRVRDGGDGKRRKILRFRQSGHYIATICAHSGADLEQSSSFRDGDPGHDETPR